MDHHSGKWIRWKYSRWKKWPLCAPDQKQTNKQTDHCQQLVQTPGSVMGWGCVRALDFRDFLVCDGSKNVEITIYFRATSTAQNTGIFSRDVHAFFNNKTQSHIPCILQYNPVLDWPACYTELSLQGMSMKKKKNMINCYGSLYNDYGLWQTTKWLIQFLRNIFPFSFPMWIKLWIDILS